MRKLILMVLVAIGLAMVVPEYGAAAPTFGSGITAAADQLSTTEEVRHRRWHRRHWRHHRHWHRRCWHRRHWSGRRCRW
jgi:hypothetical protein